MIKKITWYILLLTSVVITFIFLSGLGSSLAITTASKKTAEISPSKAIPAVLDPNYYNILVLGDSLAKGTGDENGKGFPGYFTDSFKSKISKEIKLTNIAVNGDVSSGLIKIIEAPETIAYIKSSKIIFISIGGNEITKLARTDIATATTEAKNIEDNYLANLKEIYKTVRTNNSSCMVIFIGLYNPFGKEVTADKINFLNEWNYQSEHVISTDSNSIFVPTYDLFKFNLDNYLTVDNFHPNSAGYQAISNRILEALKNYK